MIWIGFILTLFIMACMVALTLIIFKMLEWLEELEDKTDGMFELLKYRIDIMKKELIKK